ncbi:MAG: hypothetical protein ACK4F7_02145 [Inhella sp.]
MAGDTLRDDDALHSRDFAQPGFAPHGEFSLRFEDDLLIWDLHGPFNAEAMQCFRPLRRAAFARWPLADRWLAALVHWHGSALMAPEAFATYRDSLQAFLRTHGRMLVVAWVAGPEVEGLDFVRRDFEQLYRSEGVDFRLFSQVDAAKVWLREQLRTLAATGEAAQAPAPNLSRSMSMNCQKSVQNNWRR